MRTRIRARAARRDDPPRRLDPVDARHPDVHQDHVGLELGREAHRLRAVLGLADDLEVVARLEDQAEAAAHERLVVGDQDADRHRSPRAGAARDTT